VLSIPDLGYKTHSRLRHGRTASTLREWSSRWRATAFVRARFSFFAAIVDIAAITMSAIGVGVAYHGLFYHVGGLATDFAELGLFIGLLFVTSNVLREEYAIAVYLTFAGHARRVLLVWNMTFLTALVFTFVTKQTSDYSRGSVVFLYVIGFLVLIWCRAILVFHIKSSAILGKVAALRVVLVGEEAELRTFTMRYQPWTLGIDIVASSVLRGMETLTDDLKLAAASARVLRPDEVFILVPWSNDATIDECVAAFMAVPASIHLGPQPVLDRFSKASVSRFGRISSLHLVRQPLTMTEVVVKRVFDLVIAAVMLVCTVPFLLAVALAIKLDSRGPVFFLQRRYGFNQETFRIVKFRTMTVSEDGRAVKQAVRNDPRVTRVGRILRRYNIDELPQLLNVLRGNMSLVGPRPHALVHNQQFERSIATYARRHNVKPGITGWAQINGLRGEIVSETMMALRVDHDLYYIDNWTLGLDLRILGLTILSPKAFENAF
jgi:Undecaprenyl-phosphate glucose phosphotransferase